MAKATTDEALPERASTESVPLQSVTLKALLLGIGVTALVNLLPAYSGYIVHSSRMVFEHLPLVTMVVFGLVAWPLNALLGRLARGWALTREEMVVVFSMGWIGAAVPVANFMGLFIGGIAAPFYYASSENHWKDFLLDYLPKWTLPTNDAGQMTWFFEGKPPYASVPWEAWVGPLVWWGGFLLALALVNAALMVILRRQWVERERLPFPLAEAALMMTEETGGVGRYGLLGNRLFCVGLAVPLSVMVWNIGGYFWPAMPQIPLLQDRPILVARGFPSLLLKLNFFIFGFAYFTHLDILFSLWFFYLVGTVQMGIFERVGYTIGPSDIWNSIGGAEMGWQAMGAFCAFTLLGLWMGREHLKHVWRRAAFGDPTVDDTSELMSYRAALAWGGIGILYLFFWLWKSGMSALVAGVFLFALMVMTLGVSRIVAESGLVYARMPITPQSFTFYVVGTRQMELTSAAALSLSYCHFGLGNTFCASTLAHIARLGAELRLRTRALFIVAIGALVLSLVLSAWFTLHLGYRYGASNFNVYTFNAGNVVIYDNVVQKLQNPFGPSGGRAMFFGIGAAVTGLFSFLRYRFLWWPFSPIGLTVYPTWVIQRQAFTIFLAWLIKFGSLKLGGIRGYRQLQPLFMGMMLGYVAGIGLVFLVDLFFFMGQGHGIHLW